MMFDPPFRYVLHRAAQKSPQYKMPKSNYLSKTLQSKKKEPRKAMDYELFTLAKKKRKETRDKFQKTYGDKSCAKKSGLDSQ